MLIHDIYNANNEMKKVHEISTNQLYQISVNRNRSEYSLT